MIRKAFALGAVMLAAPLAGCSSEEAERGAGPDTTIASALRVVTTVSPITSLVASIAGGLARVDGIVPEGTNSHTFEPAPSMAATLAEADVVYLNGLKLEEPTLQLANANLKAGAAVVELGPLTIKPSEEIYDFAFPKEDGRPNPHLWTNPNYAKRYAEIIRDDLSARDPANAEEYARNHALLAAKIDELAEAMRAATETVPADQRKLLTYHDSFPYFARDFGWQVIGAIQPSDFSDPSPREVVELIRQVRQTGVPAIFGSEVFPSPVLEQIGKEAGTEYVDTLRDDDLPGAPGEPDHSYVGLMKADFVTMVRSLGGDPSALVAVNPQIGVTDTATYAQ